AVVRGSAKRIRAGGPVRSEGPAREARGDAALPSGRARLPADRIHVAGRRIRLRRYSHRALRSAAARVGTRRAGHHPTRTQSEGPRTTPAGRSAAQRIFCLHPYLETLMSTPNDSHAVRAWEEPVVIPTYPVMPPDPNPMFLEKRVYQGSSGKVYPN